MAARGVEHRACKVDGAKGGCTPVVTKDVHRIEALGVLRFGAGHAFPMVGGVAVEARDGVR